MAASVARLDAADGGPGTGGKAVTHGGQSAGQKRSVQAGDGQNGKEQHEKRGESDDILHRATRGMGKKSLHGVFHRVLHACCRIVLTIR